jgi:hypothetical protein
VREPGKETWLLLEDDPELEFELFLGEKLGRTLGEIRQLPSSEFLLWSRYYARRAQEKELERLKAGG